VTLPLALSNQRVQRLRRLIGRRDERRAEGLLVVEGAVLILEAAEAGWEIESQYVAPGTDPLDVGGEVERLAPGVIERVASTESPQPVLAIVRRRAVDPGIVDTADFVVVADGVSDPGNLGTMLRSAEGSGADALVVTPGTVDYTSPKVVRASAGSIFRLPVLEVSDVSEVARSGLVPIGTTSHGAAAYTDLDMTRRIALVLGNEPRGLSADTDVAEWVTIPLEGRVESLNVAMACAVLCFEVARQRRSASDTVASP
jgi:RNA methyltransferase, TrmH family